ncbi:copper resistance protein CopZ [Pseudaminobacter arsenicus]|uniref:Copper resistance protein CopZ n=1 Tax=Borborobacter arsenicus TaxID=1851146 RepID=A0A432UZW0_9HYPH|nr:nitrous oxide reductase accessory protein NosL [Pseudaminobacter arsenicus]RUM95450.1 copper resistance protein CopZ [Pseudaminobacter arsenicus]
MIRRVRPFALLAILISAGCTGETQLDAPNPAALDETAMGHYCGMNVLEHPGPKGQVILGKILEPIWFSSARDTVAFTMLPEEPKDIAAIYVSDMARAESWENPGAQNWVEARQAFYVVGSSVRGGMGAPETVPFSTRDAAAAFANKNGGQVVRFDAIPRDYVLGIEEAPQDSGGSEPAKATN